jgi:C4-dicarboxylate-specific signal transduction histidine kinase
VTIDAADNRIPNARCNAIEMQQVFTNLLIKAVEAMDEAGTADPRIPIRVTTDSRQMLNVDISDNGPGVRQDLMARHLAFFQS